MTPGGVGGRPRRAQGQAAISAHNVFCYDGNANIVIIIGIGSMFSRKINMFYNIKSRNMGDSCVADSDYTLEKSGAVAD